MRGWVLGMGWVTVGFLLRCLVDGLDGILGLFGH